MTIDWPAGVVHAARRLQRNVAFPVLAFALPSGCFVCGRTLGPVQHLGACPDCWTDLRVLRPPVCSACGLPRPEETDLLGPARGRCAACVLRASALDRVRAVVLYDRRARAVLLRAKLGGRPELLETIGVQLAHAVRGLGWADGCDVVVPAPSHPWITMVRGFSPGAILARRVARTAGLAWRRSVLHRPWSGARSLKRLGAGARRVVTAGTIRVRRDVAGQSVLLVDDVMTTGATAESCARALKRAGAAAVRLAVWARTPPTL